MPLVRIEVIEGRSPAEKRQLLEAVHAAIVEAFEVPDDDRTQRLVEHTVEDFEIPPGRSSAYVLIEIAAFPGRSADAKRKLYAAIVRRLGELDVPAEDISVIVLEPPMENWGISGGRSAADVDLGYRLDV